MMRSNSWTRSKEIVLMRHAEQLTNSQAAELAGLSEAAAGMRYLRAPIEIIAR